MLRSVSSKMITEWLAYHIVESEDERDRMLKNEAEMKARSRRRG